MSLALDPVLAVIGSLCCVAALPAGEQGAGLDPEMVFAAPRAP